MIHDTDTYKKSLDAMLEALTEELTAVGIHNPENPADWIAVPEGSGTEETESDLVADVVEAWDERSALVATLEHRYNDIIRAQKKISLGTFGICEISGEEIEPDRLAANPAARTSKAHMEEEGTLPD